MKIGIGGAVAVAIILSLVSTSFGAPAAPDAQRSVPEPSTSEQQQLEAMRKLDELSDNVERLRMELRDSARPRMPPSRRGIGWQPLKRGFAWQALKRNVPTESHVIEDHMALPQTQGRPKFTIRLRDPEALKEQLLSVVEQHLMSDLEAAEEYGIEPRAIIEDLRLKSQRSS